MNFKTLTLLLLSFTNCFSQVDFRENYYPKIYEAEQAIIKDDFKKASELYDEAFSFVKTPLAKDIFNATVCKFLLNDLNGARPLLFKLAQKGVSAQMLGTKEIFTLPDVKKMWERFKPTYESIQKETVDGYNHDYLTKTKALKDSINMSYRTTIHKTKIGKEFIYIEYSKIDFSKKRTLRYLKSLPQLDSNLVKNIELNQFKKTKVLQTLGKEFIMNEIKNGGIWSEELAPFTDENFSKNELVNDIKYYSENDVKYYGKVKLDSSFNPSIEFDFKKNTQDAYVEAISEGKVNPIEGFKMDKFGSNFLFNFLHIFQIKIEDSTGCAKKLNNNYLKYLKRGYFSLEDLKTFNIQKEIYGLDLLENLIAKEIYAVCKNQYFIFLNCKTLEESTYPNCSVAEHEMLGAEILEE